MSPSSKTALLTTVAIVRCGFGRGSRIRAGTPTASLPAGTSFVTTAPAPVRAPSPISRGATSIVSTPRNASSPIVVRCFAVPS